MKTINFKILAMLFFSSIAFFANSQKSFDEFGSKNGSIKKLFFWKKK